MRRILSLVVFAAIAFMGYNHFYGTDEDRAVNREITDGVKGVGSAVGKLFQSAKENYNDGKFDDAIEKTGNVISQLGKKAQEIGQNFPERLKELEEKRNQLDKLIETTKTTRSSEPEKQNEAIKDEMSELMEELEALKNDMDKQ